MHVTDNNREVTENGRQVIDNGRQVTDDGIQVTGYGKQVIRVKIVFFMIKPYKTKQMVQYKISPPQLTMIDKTCPNMWLIQLD